MIMPLRNVMQERIKIVANALYSDIKELFGGVGNILLMALLLLPSQCFSVDDEENYFYGESIEVLEAAYKNAPRRVYWIVDSLLGNKRGPGSYPFNYTLFDGEPGVGKSTLALAIAYKLQWDVQILGVNDFMKVENRNGTSVVFNNIMSAFEDCDDNTIIIIEEVNHLLMNYDSKHHDTDSSSMSLWLFLDGLKRNPNLFFIGTTNGIGGFPPQLESRFKAAVVSITADNNTDRIKDNLLKGLSHEKVVISDEAKTHLNQYVHLLQSYNARDIQHLVYEIQGQAYEFPEYDGDKLIIRPYHISAAFKALEDIKVRFKAKPYSETEIEQRERLHQEILAQSNQQFLLSMALGIASLITTVYYNTIASYVLPLRITS